MHFRQNQHSSLSLIQRLVMGQRIQFFENSKHTNRSPDVPQELIPDSVFALEVRLLDPGRLPFKPMSLPQRISDQRPVVLDPWGVTGGCSSHRVGRSDEPIVIYMNIRLRQLQGIGTTEAKLPANPQSQALNVRLQIRDDRIVRATDEGAAGIMFGSSGAENYSV